MPAFYPRFLGWSLLLLLSLLWSTHTALALLPKQPSLRELPSYPNAYQMRTVLPKLMGSAYHSITSFDTADAPAHVLEFYQGELLDAGWLPASAQPNQRLGFAARGCPFYYIDVHASPPHYGSTHVEVELVKTLCR